MSQQGQNRTHETFGLEANLDAVDARREASELHDHHGEDGSNDHLASIYESRDDQFESVVPFIQQGLERGERCLYVADDNTKEEVLEALSDGGIDVETARESGTLSVFTKAETYLRTGEFEQDAMLEFWRESLAEARDEEGYAGIRAAAEMTWALDGTTSLDRLVQYEAMLNTIYPGEDYVVLCQYNRERFPAEVISDVIRTHPLVVYDGTVCRNFYYNTPDEFFGSDQPPLDVDRTVEGLLSRTRTQQTLRERERGLAALTDAAQDLMQARPREVCERVVETAQDVLQLTTAAVWRYDTSADELRLDAVEGSSSVDESTLADRFADVAWETLIDGESAVYDDLQRCASPPLPGTSFESGMFLPLGRHGVLMIAATQPGAFATADIDFAKTIAATTKAALDRAERERTLHERERELERQNEVLERLNRVNAIIREIDQALVGAETRDEIEHAVCERLTTDDRFVFAWIGELDEGRLVPRESTGAERGYLDSISLAVDEEHGCDPAVDVARTRTLTVVSNVVDDVQTEPWRKQALSCGYHSIASIPLVYEDALYGVLTVCADRSSAFDEMTQTVLGELGDTIAHTINAVERKNALLTDETIELEFEITDSSCPFLSLAREAEGALEFHGVISRTGDTVDALVTATDTPLDRVLDGADGSVGIESISRINETDDGGLVQLNVSGPFIAADIVNLGAHLRSLTADPAAVRVLVEVPITVPANAIIEQVSTTYPDSELVARRQRADSTLPKGNRTRFLEQLTDRQREVAQLAYYGGYFDQPRVSTGEDLAETLDVSSQAFHQHLRSIQRKLFATTFDEETPPSGG